MAAVDLRSDTVTQPGEAMRAAMAAAPVGDDVFGEDPTVRALQDRGAELLGCEAALYVPSGSMANQLAILSHCRRGDDVLVGEGAHSYLYESGAGAVLAGVQFTVVGRGGHFSAEAVAAAAQQTDGGGHIPPSTLLMVENTHNRGGGLVMAPEDFASVCRTARAKGLAVHLDGARLFNAAAACDAPVSVWGAATDSVSVCLSKGLGAPVGSLLCGTAAFIKQAHRYRKMLGGGMRQAGIIAAGGLFALTHQHDLRPDHARARRLAEALAGMRHAVIDPAAVQTNIVIFRVPGLDPPAVCAALDDRVRVLQFGPDAIRAVTHRDVDDADIERAIAALATVLDGAPRAGRARP